MKWWMVLGPWAGLFLGGCASVESRVQHAPRLGCTDLLAEDAETRADPDYAAVPESERKPYEWQVANCLVEQKRSEAARALAKRWSKDDPERYLIEARAAAFDGDASRTEAALDGLSQKGGGGRFEFFSGQEFEKYYSKEWFIRSAVQGYDPEEGISFERHAERVLAQARQRLLPVRVAAADPARAAGEWVLWFGIVQGGQLDRQQNRTVLIAQAADASRQLESVDHPVLRVETEGHKNFWFGGYSATSRAVYGPAQLTYLEELVPIKQHFVVRFPGISESVAALPAFCVLGHYEGRDPETQEMLVSAVLIQPRSRKKITTTTDE